MAAATSSSSSSSYETDSEEDEQHSTRRDDDTDLHPPQPTHTKPHQESSDSDSESSDSEEDSSDSDKTQNPNLVVSSQPNKPTSHATGKGPEKVGNVWSGDKPDTGSKKRKVSNGDGEIEDKKGSNLFKRVFTEKDEIVLFECMIDFKEKKGLDPHSDMVAFHKSVEGLLSCDFTRRQIADKIRRLRIKFMNNVRKGSNGGDLVISSSHEDDESFKLSKKIWGSEVGAEMDGDSKVKSSRKKDDNLGSKMNVKSVGTSRKKDDNVGGKMLVKSVGKKDSVVEEAIEDDIWSLYPNLCASLEAEATRNFNGPMSPEDYVKKVVSSFDKEEARELEEEWNDIVVMEHQVYAKRMKVFSKQGEASMKVAKSLFSKRRG